MAAAAAAASGSGGGSASGSGKASKGLRHFSMKVCEKVESKGTTTYNEVADELVNEMRGDPHEDGVCYDEKNIRRRVYDAINVLMALDIIAKEKKAIMWKGFPQNRSGSTPVQRLLAEKSNLAHSVERKAEALAELIEQQKALKHVLQRNQAAGSATGTALQLPFILVQAKPDATVEVQISDDMRDVTFDFYK
jgi:transcription factor Dp-1